MNKRKVPKIRFKGFYDDWEQRKLGEVATEMAAGGDIDKDLILDEGRYPVIANALTNDGIVGYYNEDYRIKAPAVTITGRGDVGHAKARIVDFTPVVRLLSLKSNHDVFFLENSINTLKIAIESTGVPQLTVPQLAKYEISFPKSLDEEEKIGAYFKQLDHLITLHQRKLEKLKIIKKSMLENCFPKNGEKVPKIRFSGFSDDWEQRKLGDIADKAVDNRGKTPSISEEGTHPLLEVASLGSGAPDYSKVTKYLSDETFKTELRAHIKEGDILFSTVGSIGLVSLMDTNENAAIAQNIVAFRANESYDSKFLYAMLSTEGNQYKAQRIVMGAVQPSIKVSQLVDVEYFVTENIAEQRKLGEYFLNLDHLITLHQSKLEKLKMIKKSMLETMFV